MNNEKKHSRIEIKSTDGTLTELYIDGHLVRGVRSLKFEKKPREMPVLMVDLSALDISIDSPVAIEQAGYGEMEIKFKDGCTIFKQ
ncbi:MAG: hypothetical protein K2N44_02955 [Lachnospiraceae bacterium]|nr:hypothetical protein [Lachnospiraceae bacterium]